MAIKRAPVVSNNIRSIGYENGVMEIEFTNGNVYSYTGEKVSDHYQGIMKADSKGSYFTKNIRSCTKTACTKTHDAKTAKPS